MEETLFDISVPFPPTIDRKHRSTLTPDQFRVEYGVHVRSDVAKLWQDTQHHLRLSQGDQAWKDERGLWMTASRVAGVIGAAPSSYSNEKKVFMSYTQQGDGFTGNRATDWGTLHENPAICNWETVMAQEVRKVVVLPFDFIISKDRRDPFAYSPDGITNEGELVEIKCPYSRPIVPGVVPVHYERGQMQFGLHVTQPWGVQRCRFIEYSPPLSVTCPESILSETLIERDPQWAGKYVPVLNQFWQKVLRYRENGIIPEEYQGRKRRRTVSNFTPSAPQTYLPGIGNPLPPFGYFSTDLRVKKWVEGLPIRNDIFFCDKVVDHQQRDVGEEVIDNVSGTDTPPAEWWEMERAGRET